MSVYDLVEIAQRIAIAGIKRAGTVTRCPIPKGKYTWAHNITGEMFETPETPLDVDKSLDFMFPAGLDVVLTSGGLDSTITYRIAKDQARREDRLLGFRTLYCDFGQPYAPKELQTLAALGICGPTHIVKIFGDMKHALNEYGGWKHIIPGRNFLALATAATLLLPNDIHPHRERRIWFSPVQGEMPKTGGDKSFKFLDLASEAIAHWYGGPVMILTPLASGTKADWIHWWLSQGLPVETLRRTVTCFSHEMGHCGKCQACLRRYVAFAYNNIDTSNDYIVHPLIGARQYIDKYRTLMQTALDNKDFTKYSRGRCEQTLSIIGMSDES